MGYFIAILFSFTRDPLDNFCTERFGDLMAVNYPSAVPIFDIFDAGQ